MQELLGDVSHPHRSAPTSPQPGLTHRNAAPRPLDQKEGDSPIAATTTFITSSAYTPQSPIPQSPHHTSTPPQSHLFTVNSPSPPHLRKYIIRHARAAHAELAGSEARPGRCTRRCRTAARWRRASPCRREKSVKLGVQPVPAALPGVDRFEPGGPYMKPGVTADRFGSTGSVPG